MYPKFFPGILTVSYRLSLMKDTKCTFCKHCLLFSLSKMYPKFCPGIVTVSYGPSLIKDTKFICQVDNLRQDDVTGVAELTA